MATSASAVAIRIAVCASCPQACMTSTSRPRYLPLAFDAKGRPSGSLSGNASMSARHHRPWLAALEDGDNAGAGDAGLHLKTQHSEMRSNEAGGPRFLLPEFRVFVDIASPRNQLAFDLCDSLENF